AGAAGRPTRGGRGRAAWRGRRAGTRRGAAFARHRQYARHPSGLRAARRRIRTPRAAPGRARRTTAQDQRGNRIHDRESRRPPRAARRRAHVRGSARSRPRLPSPAVARARRRDERAHARALRALPGGGFLSPSRRRTMRLDDDTRAARTGLRAAALLFAPLAALCVAADVAAQPEPPAPPAPPAEPAPPPRDEAEADSALEQARRELAEARRHLEEAAREVARRSREVARLSERSFGPAVREFRRQWIGTGQRALLGLVIMDAEDGAVVSAVTPGGPADQAGIR